MANQPPSSELLLGMLSMMIRTREAEERIAILYSQQEMRCPTHLCIGQEAVSAGVTAALASSDLVFSGHRSHGHYIAKGGDLGAMFAELYGRATGCAAGKGGSQHLVDLACGFMGSAPILSSTISVGVGAAWAAQLDGRDQITVVYFGDGATEEGAFHESANFASVLKLSVIFVCENNRYSVHSAMNVRQPDRPIADLGLAHGMPSQQTDGNDAVAVYNVAQEAVRRARAGYGPSLIEANTYRWREHCGPGDDISLGYRMAAELADWERRDPIALLETCFDTKVVAKIRARAVSDVDAAVAFGRSSPFPEAAELDRHVLPENNYA